MVQLVAVLLLLAYLFAPKLFVVLWYGITNGVAFSQVHVGDKPHDCDFLRAPLGDKECHFKATVIVLNAAGDVVAGEGAPRYSRDTNTGKPIISYDNGVSWEWFGKPDFPDLAHKSVEVTWVKVDGDW